MENEIKNENVMNGENETVEAKETNKFAGLGKWIGAGVAAIAAVALGAFALTKFSKKDDSDELDTDEDEADVTDDDFEDVAE